MSKPNKSQVIKRTNILFMVSGWFIRPLHSVVDDIDIRRTSVDACSIALQFKYEKSFENDN